MSTDEVLAPTFSAIAAFAEQLRQARNPHERVPGLDWTVEELGAHVLSGARYYRRSAEEGVVGWRDLTQGPAENARLMRELAPERGNVLIADAIVDAAAQLHDTWASHEPDDELPWHGTLRLPLSTIAALVLGDLLVHGWDLSRSTHNQWVITAADANRAIAGVASIAAHFVDQDEARNFRATYSVRLRHGDQYFFAFDHGTLTVTTTTPNRIDCRLIADPDAFLLATYGRVAPTRAAVTGKIIAYGRRPWLAFQLTHLLRNP